MTAKPITVWGHWGAPNPWKVNIILEDLNVPYDMKVLELTDAKGEDHVKLNPNGRFPTIEDPNTGITLWETGAIIPYLVEQYDKEGKISYSDLRERHLTQQWLAFQVSGQGSYIGQATWFARFHPEKLPSAIDRYMNELDRIASVIELGLERNGTGWLVGDKMTYADLAFVTWGDIAKGLLIQFQKLEEFENKYPQYTGWLKKMGEKDSVTKVREQVAKGRAAHGLP